VTDKQRRQTSGEAADAELSQGHRRVGRVAIEVSALLLESFSHRETVLDVLLGSVFDADIAQVEVDFSALDHLLGIDARPHDVDLGDDTEGSDSGGVNRLGHL